MNIDPKPQTAKEIFLQAINIDSVAERLKFLESACGNSSELRRRVDALIFAHESPESLLDRVAPQLSVDAIAPTVETARDEAPVDRVGPYKLLEQIGEGGMGAVFMAEQSEPVNRRVAVKIIKPGMDSKSVIARFEAERQALALMDHPHIAKVLDAGTTGDGRPYFAMELVKGIPITEFCDKNRLTVFQRIDLFTQVCRAIHHAHQKGIIHRDIKPSNVLVTLHDGMPVPKVIDFGVAKALSCKLTDKTLFTAHFQIVGTLLYMSPEQAELSGLDIDTRSDIYSLGVLLYELLTGTTPVQQEELKKAGFDEQRRVIREQEPQRASVRLSSLGAKATAKIADSRGTDTRRLNSLVCGDLDWILCKSLEKNRTRRYDSANQFAEDCQNYLKNEVVIARAPTVRYRLSRWLYRNRVAFLVGSVVLASLLVALMVTYWQLQAQADLAARLGEKNREARETQDRLRELVFEGVVMQVMRLEREKAYKVIEQQRMGAANLRDEEVDLLLGIWQFYSGSIKDSRPHLKRARNARPDWIIPNAIWSVANTFENKTEERQHYQELNRLVKNKGEQRLTALEKLFVGHARIYLDTDLGRKTLLEVDNLALPLADAIIADSYVHEASESDDTARLLQALQHSENAVGYLGTNPYSLMVRLWAINHALLMHRERLPDREALISEGEELVDKLSRLPARGNILANIVLFYLETKEPQMALAAARMQQARIPGWMGEFWEALALLHMDGDRDAVRQLLDGSELKSDWDLFLRGILNYDEQDKVTEVCLSSLPMRNRKFVARELLLLLVKEKKFRSLQAKKIIQSLGEDATDWDVALSRFIAGSQPNPETLLEAATKSDGHRRINLSRAFLALGLDAMRRREMEEAKTWLQKCSEVKRVFECYFATAITKMLETRPVETLP